MPLNFVIGGRGRDHLIHDGFRFVMDKQNDDRKTWNCIERRHKKCTARVHTNLEEVTYYRNSHNHTADAARTEAKKNLSDLKRVALTSSETPTSLVAVQTAGITDSIAASLPSIRAMKRMIQRKRQVARYPLPLPQSLITLNIPDGFTRSLRNENFLLYDSGPAPNRILIFGTERNIELMVNSRNWYADGTFKVAPTLFEQLYTIHGVRESDVIPLIFALLPNKTEETYRRMFEALRAINVRLNPRTIMTDFERASMNAFRHVFPNADLTGCFFHFGQCLWRRLHQFADLEREYKQDPEFAVKIKSLSALALVPPEDVVDAFEVLTSDDFYSSSANLIKFVDYFEETWIGQQRRRGRMEPFFAIQYWNCFHQVAENIAKTNNSVEGWHRGFHALIGGDHPTIWRLIDGMKKEQSINELRINQYHSGQIAPPSRKKYRDSAFRLKNIVEDYGNKPIIEYLTSIAHNLNLNV